MMNIHYNVRSFVDIEHAELNWFSHDLPKTVFELNLMLYEWKYMLLKV